MQTKQSRRSSAGSSFKVDMAFHVHQQPDSGMIVSEYCRANQISEGSFYYWLKKIKNTALASLTTPAILRVKIMEASYAHASNILWRYVKLGFFNLSLQNIYLPC